MEQNSTLFQKDGKYFLQLDCENAKELSLKWDDKTYSFVKDGEKWILELPFSTAVNYVQICVDGQEVLHPDLPIGHGYGRLYNYIELPDEKKLAEIRDIPHGTLTHEFYKSEISNNWIALMLCSFISFRSVRSCSLVTAAPVNGLLSWRLVPLILKFTPLI